MRVVWGGRGTRLERRVVVPQPPGGMEIIAHRGHTSVAPESTLIAFGAAAGLAHSVEFDVQVSFDGVPVVIHDDTVDRTSDLAGNVKDLTIAQLEAGDFGSWYDARFTGAKIPRLSAALAYCSQWARLLYPEIKSYRTQADIELMVRAVLDAGLEERCVMTSFRAHDFPFVRRFSSEICVGYTAGDLATFDELLPLAASDGNAIMFASYLVLTGNPSRVARARALGVDIAVWTVPGITEVLQLADIGVYRICCDKLQHGVVPV